MRVGVIGPSENEIMPFIGEIYNKKVDSFAKLTFYSGSYGNVEIVALYCGVCKVNAAIATQLLIDRFNVTHIIVTGVAGAIDRILSIGDTVISTKIAYHDVAKGILTEYHPWMKENYFLASGDLLKASEIILKKNTFKQSIYFGKIVTGEAFVVEEGRDKIINEHNCYANNIPFIAIRSITDTVEKSGTENFHKNCKEASLNSINIMKSLIKELGLYV